MVEIRTHTLFFADHGNLFSLLAAFDRGVFPFIFKTKIKFTLKVKTIEGSIDFLLQLSFIIFIFKLF
jgi:hypothetical protein